MALINGELLGKQRSIVMINLNALSQINKIIEHDKVSSTYKFALLKSTIDACQRYEHLITFEGEMALIPIGLLVESWIFDYLPFVFNSLRQQNSGNVLNREIESAYQQLFDTLKLSPLLTTWEDAYQTIYKQYSLLQMTSEQSRIMLRLSQAIAKTITTMPMRYSGATDYEIFIPDKKNFGRINITGHFNREFLVNTFDTFKISKDHYNIFRYMGQSLYGVSTIARRWKEITYKLNNKSLMIDSVDTMIFKTIFTDRDTKVGRKYLPEDCECVWTNKPLVNGHYDVDHLLPYSVWLNNDLWNLLPSDPKINNQKSDKIPAPSLIDRQRELIISYWDIYEKAVPELFEYQVRTSLTIKSADKNNLIDSLCKKAEYLIDQRGYDAFEIML